MLDQAKMNPQNVFFAAVYPIRQPTSAAVIPITGISLYFDPAAVNRRAAAAGRNRDQCQHAEQLDKNHMRPPYSLVCTFPQPMRFPPTAPLGSR